jgi:thymidylate synthase (FAD)
MDIAKAIKKIFICEFPTISRAMEWCDEKCDCPHDYDGMDQPCIMIL